jgi:DNA polymerase V
MKSFYASVECVYRDLDPLKANLLVADDSRSDATICLAVSPSLKAKGVPGRPRLFEAKQAITAWERQNRKKVSYLIALPRMAEYERVSALIYSVILKYVAPEDVHVYSIDESFINCEPYLNQYEGEARKLGVEPARLMAIEIVRDVLKTTGITATVGIGTNMYLAKVCMDIVAKKMPADKDGVRIAELNEESYCYLLWNHKPLTDFWMIGPGKAKRLEKAFLFTMGDIARKSQYDEEWFYKEFGIDGEIMIAHAWGVDPVTLRDIKTYHTDSHSLSKGQVLPRPYEYAEARNAFCEMVDVLCADMFSKNLLSQSFTWWVSYDWKSLEKDPHYSGPVAVDFYGRLHPKHNNGTVKMRERTNSPKLVMDALTASFDQKTDHHLLFRRLGICASNVTTDDGVFQLDFFTDYDALEKEKKIQGALLEVRSKYGANALFTGKNMMKGATTLGRNMQIGGHRA